MRHLDAGTRAFWEVVVSNLDGPVRLESWPHAGNQLPRALPPSSHRLALLPADAVEAWASIAVPRPRWLGSAMVGLAGQVILTMGGMRLCHLAMAPDHLGAHPGSDIRRPSRVRWLHLPTDVAGERLAPACRRCRLPRRIHRALPGQGDLSTRAHPWHASRAGCAAAAGGDHRILELSAPAAAARGESLADSSRPEHGTRTATSGRCSRGLRTERLVHPHPR
jgi:hypothetical protein